METNTLVKHKKLKSLGIGCVAKVLKTKLKVNFGKEDVLDVKPADLEIVDTSKCKTIKLHEFNVKSMNNSFKGGVVRVIIGNEVKEYVGIGWVHQHVVTEEDLKKYPRLIQ